LSNQNNFKKIVWSEPDSQPESTNQTHDLKYEIGMTSKQERKKIPQKKLKQYESWLGLILQIHCPGHEIWVIPLKANSKKQEARFLIKQILWDTIEKKINKKNNVEQKNSNYMN